MPAISVIMSVRNGASDLEKSIPSILNQTFSDFEFIICDDGSTDNTLDVLKHYADLDNRIVLIHNESSKGLAYSLNRCIDLAKSEILARQDSDDSSELNRFELQYKYVLQHPEYAIVGTCWNNIDSKGNSRKITVKENPTARDMVQGGLFMHPSWMMRKSLVSRVGYYTVSKYTMRSQDYHLVMKVLGAGMKLHNMQIYTYNYTANSDTTSRYFVKSWKRVKSLMWIRYDSYRRNKLPIFSYVYVIKPLIQYLLPTFILKQYYKKAYGNG